MKIDLLSSDELQEIYDKILAEGWTSTGHEMNPHSRGCVEQEWLKLIAQRKVEEANGELAKRQYWHAEYNRKLPTGERERS